MTGTALAIVRRRNGGRRKPLAVLSGNIRREDATSPRKHVQCAPAQHAGNTLAANLAAARELANADAARQAKHGQQVVKGRNTAKTAAVARQLCAEMMSKAPKPPADGAERIAAANGLMLELCAALITRGVIPVESATAGCTIERELLAQVEGFLGWIQTRYLDSISVAEHGALLRAQVSEINRCIDALVSGGELRKFVGSLTSTVSSRPSELLSSAGDKCSLDDNKAVKMEIQCENKNQQHPANAAVQPMAAAAAIISPATKSPRQKPRKPRLSRRNAKAREPAVPAQHGRRVRVRKPSVPVQRPMSAVKPLPPARKPAVPTRPKSQPTNHVRVRPAAVPGSGQSQLAGAKLAGVQPAVNSKRRRKASTKPVQTMPSKGYSSNREALCMAAATAAADLKVNLAQSTGDVAQQKTSEKASSDSKDLQQCTRHNRGDFEEYIARFTAKRAELQGIPGNK